MSGILALKICSIKRFTSQNIFDYMSTINDSLCLMRTEMNQYAVSSAASKKQADVSFFLFFPLRHYSL